MTLTEIATGKNFTTNETIIVLHLYRELSDYFGESYSDVDCNDIAKDLKFDVKKVKGIVGSLVKKGILTTYSTGSGYEVICFVNQEEMTLPETSN